MKGHWKTSLSEDIYEMYVFPLLNESEQYESEQKVVKVKFALGEYQGRREM